MIHIIYKCTENIIKIHYQFTKMKNLHIMAASFVKKNKFLCLVHIFQAFTFELASQLINKGRGKNYTSIINNKGQNDANISKSNYIIYQICPNHKNKHSLNTIQTGKSVSSFNLTIIQAIYRTMCIKHCSILSLY